MKVIVLGAAGRSGRTLVRGAVARGHAVTALARTPDRVADLVAELPPASVAVVAGDVRDTAATTAAIAGHDAVINAAGAVYDDDHVALIDGVVAAAAAALEPGGRLWLYGGAAILPIAGTPWLAVDLPLVPKVYRRQRETFARVARTTLDWSMACPGPMNPAPGGSARSDLRVSVDAWPVPHPRPGVLPRLALTLAVARDRPALVVTYEDVAAVVLDHLGRDGPLRHKRVGFALPPGERGVRQPG